MTSRLLLGAAALLTLGCGQLLGVDDFVAGGSGAAGAGGSGTGATTGGTTSSSQSTTTGSTGCSGNDTLCGSTCVDLDTRDDHCGVCDHSCLGGVCEHGACQPVVLAEDLDGTTRMALDATHVYWLSKGGCVRRVGKGAGSTIEMLTDKADPNASAIAVDSTTVYWLEPGNKLIKQVGTTGGQAGDFYTNAIAAKDLAVDDTAVYWTSNESSSNGGGLHAQPKDEMPAKVAKIDSALWLTIDATTAYVAHGAGSYASLTAVKKADMATKDLTSGEEAIGDIANDADTIYWSVATEKSIRAVKKIGDSGAHDLAKLGLEPTVIAVDPAAGSGYVYWAVSSYDIGRVDKQGGGPEALPSAHGEVRDLAVDEDAIYWLEPTVIRKLAKPLELD